MKAVIVDIKGKYAVALNKNGEFVKLRNSGKYEIGYEYDIKADYGSGRNTVLRAASIAAAFIFTLGLGYGVYSYNNPYSYIDIDINPSIEIVANVYDRIISVKGLNDDGTELLADSSFKNKKLNEGIGKILDSAAGKGYLLADSQNAVVFTVSSRDDEKAAEIERNVQLAAKEELEAVNVDSDILVEKVDENKRSEAEELGITPGKLNLIKRLVEDDPNLKVEDYKDSSVRDILEAINDNKKSGKEDDTKENTQERLEDSTKDSTGENGNNGEKEGKSKSTGRNDSSKNENTGFINRMENTSQKSGNKETGSDKYGENEENGKKTAEDDKTGSRNESSGNADNSGSKQGKNENGIDSDNSTGKSGKVIRDEGTGGPDREGGNNAFGGNESSITEDKKTDKAGKANGPPGIDEGVKSGGRNGSSAGSGDNNNSDEDKSKVKK